MPIGVRVNNFIVGRRWSFRESFEIVNLPILLEIENTGRLNGGANKGYGKERVIG